MLCLILTTLVALPPPAKSMTLPEALAYARAHQPSLAAVRARLAGAEADTKVPRAQWFPRFGATAQLIGGSENNSTASYIGTPAVDIIRIGSGAVSANATGRPEASTLVAVGVRQEVFDFGRIGALSRVADALAQQQRETLSAASLDLDLAVSEAFFGVGAAKAVLEVARGVEERSRVTRDTAAAGVKAGLRKPIDLTRSEADLGRFEVARIRAEGNVAYAQAAFAAVVGAPDRTLDATLGAGPSFSEPPALDDAIASALAKDPAVHALEAEVLSQQARTRAIGAELRPDLFFTAAGSARAGGNPSSNNVVPYGEGWVPDVPNWNVGLVVSWPVFDATVLARADSSAALENARSAELEAVKQRVSATVQQQWQTVIIAKEALPALERSAQAARANDEQAVARFTAGLSTALELADAEQLRMEAEIQFALGGFDLARARARLARTTAEGL